MQAKNHEPPTLARGKCHPGYQADSDSGSGLFSKMSLLQTKGSNVVLLPASEMLVSSGITCCRKLGWKGDRAVMWPLLLVTTKHREASLVSLLFLR